MDFADWLQPAVAAIVVIVWVLRRLARAGRPAPRVEPPPKSGEVSSRPIHPR